MTYLTYFFWFVFGALAYSLWPKKKERVYSCKRCKDVGKIFDLSLDSEIACPDCKPTQPAGKEYDPPSHMDGKSKTQAYLDYLDLSKEDYRKFTGSFVSTKGTVYQGKLIGVYRLDDYLSFDFEIKANKTLAIAKFFIVDHRGLTLFPQAETECHLLKDDVLRITYDFDVEIK